ncbi:MAG: hypothetical protein LBU65_01400 [Planctomycetaceae bacterium]|jgi:hypothetical protein|nr:hypothetical protein [Planctomycetaceae bacterium]
MRIISDFHDYYDVGMQNGIDPKLPYMRFRREENIEKFSHKLSPMRRWITGCRIFFVGFAGKIYPSIKYSGDSTNVDYDFDLKNLTDDFFLQTLEAHDDFWWSWSQKSEKNRNRMLSRMREIFNEIIEQNCNELLSLFEQFKTAIFVFQFGAEKVFINERLNQYNFQKVLPPIQAFQELEMYVGSYLTQPVIEEPPISDKIKAEIHGFDKHSFRKEKKV